MKKSNILITIGFLLLSLSIFADARKGVAFSPKGTYRVLVVFAEMINYYPKSLNEGQGPLDVASLGIWNPGCMPPNPDSLIDHQFTNPQSIRGALTKYFYDSSRGKLIFLGDYYPKLVQVNYDSLYSGDCTYKVINILNADTDNGNDIITKHGYSTNSDAFDMWSLSSTGAPKPNVLDKMIDVLMIIWRTNRNITPYRNGGFMTLNPSSYSLKQKQGFDRYSGIVCSDIIPTFRHEFAHTLIGDNNFHSAPADGGEGNFLSSIGGYSFLSGTAKNLESVNGWDRWRLGWSDTISARTVAGSKIQSDLDYITMQDSVDYVLQDFTSTGDVVRIKLPYLQLENSSTKNQYIWLENHQLKPEMYESKYPRPIAKGLRVNIEIGNDDLNLYNSKSNNIIPISSFGKYDFSYNNIHYDADHGTYDCDAITSTSMSNPLTGYSLLEDQAYDFPQYQALNHLWRPISSIPDMIYNREFVTPRTVVFDNNQIYSDAPIISGNTHNIFSQNAKLSLSSNPSCTPVMNYSVQNRNYIEQANPNWSIGDNRFIYLNGLSIKVIEQMANGDVRVRIKRRDYDVNNDLRWCGPIVLNERIYLKSNKTITLDQGLTPTRPVNPMLFNEQKVFADPTIFTAKGGSYFKLEANSNVVVKNNSALVFESGSSLEINTGAKLTVKTGSTLQIKSGAKVMIIGNGQINVESGGYLCIEQGTLDTLNLKDATSFVNLQDGSFYGTNPAVIPTSTCTAIGSIKKTGSGQINNYKEDLYIQNQTISTSKYYAGKNIYVAGSGGAVLINNNNATVTFDAAQDVIFQNGFEVSLGASYEVLKH